MQDLLLIGVSVSVLRVIWLFLGATFRRIEKAHEHLREQERLRGDAELVKGLGG